MMKLMQKKKKWMMIMTVGLPNDVILNLPQAFELLSVCCK